MFRDARNRDISQWSFFTGIAKATTGHRANVMAQFSGYVDVSGSIESKQYAPDISGYRGTLLANSGKGSGEWFSERCGGTFELSRVE